MQTEKLKTPVSRATTLTIFSTFILLLISVSFVAANVALSLQDAIYEGVVIGDISVGGLSQQEARDKVASVWSIRSAEPLRLIYGDKEWSLSADELELTIADDELVRQAYQVGRHGNIYTQFKERYLTANQGYTIPFRININSDKLNALLTTISKTIDREPQDAALIVKGQSVILIKDKIGKKVDIKKTGHNIISDITSQQKRLVNLVVEEKIPEIRTNDLEGIDSVYASYTTEFSLADRNRADNIILAAKSVNNIIVRHGESFSFNEKVGLRLKERGYKMAPGYINGVLVPDWGGGVCQVTTTMYNAALLADMTIDERTSHFRPPGYVPLGLDATVADNYLDFKFRNTTTGNIFIKTNIDGNSITVTILGKKHEMMPEIEIITADKKVIEPKTIIKQDDKLELGKRVVEAEAEKGFIVSVYRIKKRNGKEIGREFISYDEFTPVDSVIRVGTKPPEQPVKQKL